MMNDICYIYVIGRLGNVMFSITNGMYYATSNHKKPIVVYSEDYYNDRKGTIFNSFESIKITDVHDGCKMFLENGPQTYTNMPSCEGNVFIRGYRQTPMYWNNDISFAQKLWYDAFNLYDVQESVKKLYPNINFDDMTCINVRRGDYTLDINRKYLGLLDDEYFKKCIDLLGATEKYFIVSDDIDYCKNVFVGDNFYFNDTYDELYGKELFDLAACSICHNNITSNSTFSWWGAYLNKHHDKKCFIPKPFFVQFSSDIYEYNDNWIIMDSVWKK